MPKQTNVLGKIFVRAILAYTDVQAYLHPVPYDEFNRHQVGFDLVKIDPTSIKAVYDAASSILDDTATPGADGVHVLLLLTGGNHAASLHSQAHHLRRQVRALVAACQQARIPKTRVAVMAYANSSDPLYKALLAFDVMHNLRAAPLNDMIRACLDPATGTASLPQAISDYCRQINGSHGWWKKRIPNGQVITLAPPSRQHVTFNVAVPIPADRTQLHFHDLGPRDGLRYSLLQYPLNWQPRDVAQLVEAQYVPLPQVASMAEKRKPPHEGILTATQAGSPKQAKLEAPATDDLDP